MLQRDDEGRRAAAHRLADILQQHGVSRRQPPTRLQLIIALIVGLVLGLVVGWLLWGVP
jgi:hypothetical protein